MRARDVRLLIEGTGTMVFNRQAMAHVGSLDLMVLFPLSIRIPLTSEGLGWMGKRTVTLYHHLWGTWQLCCCWQGQTPPPSLVH